MAQIKPDKDGNYSLAWIKANPIPAKCLKCKRLWVEGNGNGAIFAPTLDCCVCFYCHGDLAPLDETAYRERLRSLGYNVAPVQAGLFV